MDDISREPFPEGARPERPGRRGPTEVVRLDEGIVDELDGIGGRFLAKTRLVPAEPVLGEADVKPAEEGGPARKAHAEPEVPQDREARDDRAEFEELEDPGPFEHGEFDAGEREELDADADAAEDGALPARELDLPVVEDDEDLPELTDPAELSRVLFAVLLATREAMKPLRLAEICNSTQKIVGEALERLERDLRDHGYPLTVAWTGDHVRLLTVPDVFPWLRRVRKVKKAERLSPAALETLAVVAYRQPVIRAEIEAIRGVKVGPMLKSLLDHKLVKVVGRADVPGRPLQYGTTDTFLERFGLASLKDLPSVQEFRSLG